MISDISNGAGTKFSRNAIILAIVMIVNVAIIIFDSQSALDNANPP